MGRTRGVVSSAQKGHKGGGGLWETLVVCPREGRTDAMAHPVTLSKTTIKIENSIPKKGHMGTPNVFSQSTCTDEETEKRPG